MLHEENKLANIILSFSEQELFYQIDKAIYPVSNKWCSGGWATFELKKLDSH